MISDEFHQKRLEDIDQGRIMAETLKQRDSWDREKLCHFQQDELDRLVRYAVRHSPFYRKLYSAVDLRKPVSLASLPPTDKTIIMENFDTVVTDSRLKIDILYQYIEDLSGDDYYLGEYRVLTSAGSSGFKGIFVYDRQAWSVFLASLERARAMMDITREIASLKVTSIGADSPLHLSYRRALSTGINHQKSQRLEATAPLEDIVAALNLFQPDYIHTYPSIASLLAGEQQEKQLHIQPRIMVTGAEVLTGDTIRKIREAWGIVPFNAYSSTEGILGIECFYHKGVHIFEDLCIVEVMDEDNNPVPDGYPGHKILFTNLYQYTQPLIRYEISDMMTMDRELCPCGRPFRLIQSIHGRNDDIIYLENENGKTVPILPLHFYTPIETLHEVRDFQVVKKRDGLHLRLVLQKGVLQQKAVSRIRTILRREIEALRIKCPKIFLEFTEKIERNPQHMGKKVLFLREDA